jgi:chromate reductase
MNVCVLVGSLRKASFNGMLANALISLAPSLMKLDIVEVGQLPFYNEDLETAVPPAQWTAFRQRVKAADAVLFVTPEYNRSVPAVLKNALDVGSRPYGSIARRDRSLRRQSSSQAVACFSECSDHAAAGSLCWPCRKALR